MSAEIAQLAALLDACTRAVVFTGAGISTESGIPDFRSPGGLWSHARPIEFQDFLASEETRREAWRRKIISEQTMGAAQPNRGHRAVAELVRRGTCACVITQNIDGLHQRSGIPQGNIVELHGNGTYAACLTCGLRRELGPILEAFARDESLPVCNRCTGIIKTATISFGQPMPVAALTRAREETLACDLFLVLGSSLVVYPAADFPLEAKRRGAKLAIVNREPTHLDEIADLAINSEIGATLGQAVRVA